MPVDPPLNPILTYLPLNGSLAGRDRNGAFSATGSGALRWQPAEGARVNLFENPAFGVTDSKYQESCSSTIETTSPKAMFGTNALKVTVTNISVSPYLALHSFSSLRSRYKSNTTYTMSLYVYHECVSNRAVRAWPQTSDLVSSPMSLVNHYGIFTNVPSHTMTRVSHTFTTNSNSGEALRLFVQLRSTEAAVGDVFWVSAVLVEESATVGDYFDGSSPGCTWLDPRTGQLGTPHASPSCNQVTAWIEEGTTNLILNPSVELNASNLNSIGSGVTLTKDTTTAYLGTASALSSCDGTTGNYQGIGFITGSITAPVGTVFTGQVRIKSTAGKTIRILIREALSGALTQTTIVTNGGWQYVTLSHTLAVANPTLLHIRLDRWDSTAAYSLNVDCVQLEQKSYATSYCDGSLGTGYSWAGTTHASTSTRAASQITFPTGILSPASGAIAFRVTPTIETGLEEIWGECGAKGSGTDHLRWGRDASKHPFVEWSSNDAAYQRLTASETIDAGTEKFLYFGHAGTATSLQVDSGTLQTGSRAAVSASFGAGPLKLQATAGGNIVSPFATYDQPLSAARIAIVRDAMANGDDLWTLFEEWEAIIQPTNLLPLQSGEATAGARATVTPATIPLTAQSLTGTSGASAEVEAAELVVAGQAAKAGAIRQLPDTVEWSKP